MARSVRLPETVNTALERRAESDERSVNKMIVWLLRQALAEELSQLERERVAADAAADAAAEAAEDEDRSFP